ncbi:hypothetical protein M3M39_00195 [Fructilactobacillus hinvesii]|uniref:DUF1310 family protein n=1 Tax=Fructilactobacillus hinvesii TaxID=2940300 RepID=A0ABY5BU39_9LACO|nr:hypothetical protein [Fructilactobacillus hinvesii]USS87947.1 hypothetical protein M3M39_00195 [Fructilactobacillus hinvesii]
MKRSKQLILLVLSGLLLLTLAGCRNFSLTNQGHDYVKVYDAKDHLLQQTNQLGKLKQITDNKYHVLNHAPVPKDAQVNYRYVVHQRKHNLKLNVVVYANYKLAKISGVPIMGSGTINLSQRQFEELNDPDRALSK